MNPGVESSVSLNRFIGDGFDLFKVRRVGNDVKGFTAVGFDFFNQRF